MLQLDVLCMDDIAKNRIFCPFEEILAGMSRSMTRQRDGLHAVDDCLGATKGCHLPALIYGAAMACALWKNGWASLGALAAIPATAKSRFLPSPRRLRHLEKRDFRPEW